MFFFRKTVTNLTGIVLAIVIMFSLFVIPVKADEISLGVSPSYFNDITLERGQSHEIKFNVSNSSRYSGGQADLKEKIYSIDVVLESSDMTGYDFEDEQLTEQEKDMLMPSRWVEFPIKKFTVKPNESRQISAVISVPEQAEMGEYIVLINVVKDTEGAENTSVSKFSAFLEIPVFISVVDPITKTNNSKYDYKITEFDVGDATDTQGLFYVVKNLLKFDDNWWTRIDNFLHKPFKFSYKIKGNESIVYDIPKAKKVSLREVSTVQREEMNKSRYILLPDGLNDSVPIQNISYQDSNIILTLGDKKFIMETPGKEVVADINNQILNLTAMVNTEPTFGWFLDNIKLNKRIDYKEINLKISYKIKNTGDKVIIPSGSLNVFDQNNQIIDQINYPHTIILPGVEREVAVILPYNPVKYLPGKYMVKSSIEVFNGAEPEIYVTEIKFANLRTYIWIGFSIILIVVLFILFFTVRLIIVSTKKRRHMITEKESTLPNKDASTD